MERHILIVDDEINILNALERVLEEQDDYVVYRACCGEEGLDTIDAHPEIGVVLSDQRMPNMTGTEFLKQVKSKHNSVVRMILSGYSELATITQAINEGSIFKFLTKPWDEQLLLNAIEEAFEYYELADQNRRLTQQLQATNQQLAEFNASLEAIVAEKTRRLQLHIASLKVYQDAMEHFPFAVIGLDDAGSVVLENNAARQLFSKQQNSLLGLPASIAFQGNWSTLSPQLEAFGQQDHIQTQIPFNDNIITIVRLGSGAEFIGQLLISMPLTQRTTA
ncbi:response regulator [Ketobacter alkanivorans]|uniref:Response regulatory domain-containing protein n=1 Tax=Ketobacter alkanivorans TaxID=1917421 RepID=A0A2K9LKF2_9GAMM|nr:response regulator [Ketobacter alkanivorans]AUM12762.1 hypothetical protein Kalk_10175 [Ketobacter alkanivorans]